MPSLSKKGNKRRQRTQKHLITSVKQANAVLRANKEAKDRKQYGNSWKYGDLSVNEALSSSHKLIDKKIRNIQNRHRNTRYDNLTRNNILNKFSKKHINLSKSINYQSRDVDFIDPSDNDDSEYENNLNLKYDDDIFKLRRNKKKNINSDNEYETSNDDLESSGDDLNQNDNDINYTQKDIEENDDSNNFINENDDNDNDTDIEMTENSEILNKIDVDKMPFDELQNLVNKKYSLMSNNSKSYQMLNISNQINNSNNINDDNNDNASSSNSDSDNGSIFSDFSDIERNDNVPKNPNSFVNDVRSGVGDINWGSNRKNFYGSELNNNNNYLNDDEYFNRLREEETIGMQMELDELGQAKPLDYMDEDMMNEIKQGPPKNEDVERLDVTNKDTNTNIEHVSKKRKLNKNINLSDDDEDISINMYENSNNNNNNQVIETVKKNVKDIKAKKLKSIVRKRYPELQNIICELKKTVSELENVNNNRIQLVLNSNNKNCIEDTNLYLDLLRTYGSVLSFYVKLKTSSKLGNTHSIYSRMLQLQRRIEAMKPIYEDSLKNLKMSKKSFKTKSRNKKDVRKMMDLEWEEKEDLRLRQETKNKQRLERIKKDKIAKSIEKEMINQYITKQQQRLNSWNVKEDNGENRRGISMRIFKTGGLKRYRTPGIPRIKLKKKYAKQQKRLKKAGFKPFKGKKRNHYGQWNIPVNLTHSKKF